ncbi:hypothetical protein RZS08_30670, partial [Arthrospira platensis SPKY1]|nr:hypothetical protein [Arthrospira platensis SPKY1]
MRACRFEYMTYVGEGGIGIYAKDGSLLVNAAVVSETQVQDPCEFNGNEEVGVSGSGANLDIRNAKFYGSQPWGILSYNNLEGEKVTIRNNTISMNNPACFAGIHVERPVASGSAAHLAIAYNEIDMVSLNPLGGMYGIFIAGVETAIDHANINNN